VSSCCREAGQQRRGAMSTHDRLGLHISGTDSPRQVLDHTSSTVSRTFECSANSSCVCYTELPLYYCIEDYKPLGQLLRNASLPAAAAQGTSGEAARACAAACTAELRCTSFQAIGQHLGKEFEASCVLPVSNACIPSTCGCACISTCAAVLVGAMHAIRAYVTQPARLATQHLLQLLLPPHNSHEDFTVCTTVGALTAFTGAT
jgi:hypothetical protein